jgi:asparagine synthetase B (glutamine-hydrolysing)
VKKISVLAAIASMAMAVPTMAQSRLSPEEEQRLSKELGTCFTLKSTGEDRLAFARWFVVALASAPTTQGIVAIQDGKKDELDASVARIFTRLLTEDCAAEARPLWKARSVAGFKVAGEALGRLAMQEVMSGEGSDKMLGGYLARINNDDFKKLEE